MRRQSLVASLFVMMCLATIGLVLAQPAPDANSVLILERSVSGDPSREGAFAASQGFTVVRANDAQWAGRTAADFASFRALIIGDPTCSTDISTVAAAAGNASTWGPAATGNVIIIGSDPVYHYNSQPGARDLIDRGIAFAAADPAMTGAYVDLSCYYHFSGSGTSVPLLDGFAVGGFTVIGAGLLPGLNDVHIVAAHPALAGLTDADLSNWGNSVHEGFVTWPVSFEALAIARDAAGSYIAPDGTVGYPYILARGVTVISDITLSPESATNLVGTSHTLTAVVEEDGAPIAGTEVTFEIVGGPNTGWTSTAVTNASGEAFWTYSSAVVGTDTIQATYVSTAGVPQRSNRVTKEWVIADDTPPRCELTAVFPGPPLAIQVTTQDTGPAGLKEINILELVNATVTIPPFTPGTTAEVIVDAVKINNALAAHLTLEVLDVSGNRTECDPVLTEQVRSTGKPVTATFTDLPDTDTQVRIINSTPGLKHLDIVVNGHKIKVNGMVDDEVIDIDCTQFMVPGDNNVYELTARGKPGGSAAVMIWDGQ